MRAPADKISVGIHTESKGFVLDEPATEENCPGENCPEGLYCRAPGTPNIVYSLFSITKSSRCSTTTQFLTQSCLPFGPTSGQASTSGSSTSQRMGRRTAATWLLLMLTKDETSVAKKARHVNHYGLKGIFLWEIDSDNFKGKRPFTILSEIKEVLLSAAGLTLGSGAENQGCTRGPDVSHIESISYLGAIWLLAI